MTSTEDSGDSNVVNIIIDLNGGFYPPEKILVRLDDHPNYWGKSKMFQTTNQIYIHTSIQFS
jgi:hypothetical protein